MNVYVTEFSALIARRANRADAYETYIASHPFERPFLVLNGDAVEL